jgi:CheY-like chemotaxis protein
MERTRKILAVDDNPSIRRLIRLTLEGPYEVLEAENGVTAMALVREHLPDLVILDIMMPGTMDGLQVLEAIKADPSLHKVLVVMVTARGQANDYDIGMQKGANAYIVKPFSPLQLMDWVRTHLE